ncbi:hypothetical protein [Polaromonas sp. CG_23.6]|uniref:hypothetical protein n=1 Tax=Polaromonas sp. CG_23.6 TaxID=2760709 RepID=UPI002473128D|nr:hypothetical protein [Polaromonas sp. CG_23.6]MDH6183578.1 hypothetical protein [Polaromonas sp. CG_23.6]
MHSHLGFFGLGSPFDLECERQVVIDDKVLESRHCLQQARSLSGVAAAIQHGAVFANLLNGFVKGEVRIAAQPLDTLFPVKHKSMMKSALAVFGHRQLQSRMAEKGIFNCF